MISERSGTDSMRDGIKALEWRIEDFGTALL
jgi:hypothetical protein